MILHYYLNEKYVGPVDIETFFDVKNSKTLITITEDCELLLGALDLVYGKKIQRFHSAEAYRTRFGKPVAKSGKVSSPFPAHVFLTKKCGKVIQWDDQNMAILCNH